MEIIDDATIFFRSGTSQSFRLIGNKFLQFTREEAKDSNKDKKSIINF